VWQVGQREKGWAEKDPKGESVLLLVAVVVGLIDEMM